MTAQIYAPRMRQIPPPCGKDCPGREPGCSARCCSWALYESMWMNHVMQDDRGNWYGWGRVLDYIGVEWRDPEAALLNPDELPGQMVFEGMEDI